MFLLHSPKRNNKEVKLAGAVQVSGRTFFAFRSKEGEIRLKSEKDEKLQKAIIKKMIDLNPSVKRLLNKFKLKTRIDTKILRELAHGHMNDTCKVAMGIYSMLTDKLKQSVDGKAIKEASMLHDLGKVLIPSKVLNKPAKLNSKERAIMNIHSRLGYELLKTQGINEETLNLVKYHHQNLQHTGYPIISDDSEISDIGVQIISTADKYSALREARVYRRKLSRIESLLILYKEVLEGKIHKDVYKALFEYATIYDKAA